MIQRLHIKNYAIIDELEIRFSKELTIITGETGAGKSILLGALGLIMGKRADTKMLHNTERKCVVEGHFDIEHYQLQPFFEEHDLDYETDTVLRRELTPSGKSRAFINDTPVNLATLQQLSGALIDLHQQFDTRDINNVSFQLRMIDALAKNGTALAAYQSHFRKYQKDKKQLASLIHQNETANKELDFLNFQLNEFNEAALIAGEQEQMEEELARLTNSEDIKRALGAAYRQLADSEHSSISQLEEISQLIGQIKGFDPKLETLYERYTGLIYELQDLSSEFEAIAEATEYDEERIQEVQSRLDLIYRLQKKHQAADVAQLLQIQEDLQQRLTAYEDLSSGIERLEKSLKKQEATLLKLAQELSQKRKKVIGGFEQKVEQMLGMLSMENARIKIQINPLTQLSATGLDDVQFLFAPNKGSSFSSIKNVASGGELSRLTLCIKSLVASAIPLPTLIFDEIDTGVSGDVALKMGRILKELASQHQVVSITHTPQIAVKANAHYFVFKQSESNRTFTSIKLLNSQERIQEIATMLSGSPPTPSAVRNARELLKL
ncbi:MAG: DNA repair protein RecN [Bacteroidota bacterium]